MKNWEWNGENSRTEKVEQVLSMNSVPRRKVEDGDTESFAPFAPEIPEWNLHQRFEWPHLFRRDHHTNVTVFIKSRTDGRTPGFRAKRAKSKIAGSWIWNRLWGVRSASRSIPFLDFDFWFLLHDLTHQTSNTDKSSSYRWDPSGIITHLSAQCRSERRPNSVKAYQRFD